MWVNLQGCGLNIMLRRPRRRHVGVSTAAHMKAFNSIYFKNKLGKVSKFQIPFSLFLPFTKINSEGQVHRDGHKVGVKFDLYEATATAAATAEDQIFIPEWSWSITFFETDPTAQEELMNQNV